MAQVQVDGVLDLTFLDIRDETDLANQITEKLALLSSTQASETTEQSTSKSSTLSPGRARSPGRTRRRSEIKAIRLGNNQLSKCESLFVISTLINTQSLLWLDLSFNELTYIHPDFGRHFPNLTTIYLQANKIARLADIRHLSTCSQLRSLAVFGNPMEERKHYRNYILYNCPQLAQFDKSPVTKFQRQQMEVWAQTFRKKLNPDQEED